MPTTKTSTRSLDWTNLTDEELVEQIAQGESLALSAVHARYAAKIKSIAYGIIRDQDLAADVTQEVFERLWLRTDRFDSERGSLGTYLSVDAHGRSIDLVRSLNASKARELNDVVRSAGEKPADTADEALRRLDASQVRSSLASLPEEQRVPIALAFFEGISYRQVAEQLRTPEGTVKSRIRAGLQTLSSSLGDLATVS